MRITVEYLLSPDEFRRATTVIRSRYRIYLWVLAAAFGAFGVVQLVRGDAYVATFCLLLVPFYLVADAGRLGIGRSAAEFERRVRAPIIAVFTDETFATHSATANIEVPWRTLNKVVETSEFFLMYSSPGSAVIIPKRVFAPADAAQLSAFLRNTPP
jgi:hypothetical protein